MSGPRGRVHEAWAWIGRPWRSPALLASLVAAFAAPVVMSASADLFTVEAGDRIAERLVDDAGSSTDVVIAASGRFDTGVVAELETSIEDRLARVGELGAPSLTFATDALGFGAPPTSGEPVEIVPGSGGRFLVREGAVGALDVIAGRPGDEEGIWVSESYADDFGLSPGDELAIEDSGTTVVAGIYRDLWDGDRDEYWNEVPSVYVPRFSRIFGAPLFELFVVSASTADELGLRGLARFDVEVERPPDDLDGLERLSARLRAVEADLTDDERIAAAVDAFSGEGAPRPTLSTGVFDVEDDALERVARLDQPIATTAIAGIAVGLVVSMAAGGFVARRRRRELRLLRADGDPTWRFFARSVGEWLVPGLLGTLIGIVVGWALVRAFGPTGTAEIRDVDVTLAFACGAAGVLAASVTTAVIAGRALEPPHRSTDRTLARWLLPTVLLATAAWVQVGAAGSDGDVDLLVVIFPIAALVAGVGIAVALARWIATRRRRSGAEARTPLFLAWRRLVAAESGALAMAVVVGTAFGLVMFPSLLVAALDDAATAKATAAVGGRSAAQLDGPLDPVPADATVIGLQTTRVSVGGRRVAVQVVDAATYADGVSWDARFGSSSPTSVVDELLAAADTVDDDAVPAVLVGVSRLPATGAFGTDETYDYEIVRTLDAAPLAGSTAPTLIVLADRLDEVALERHLRARPAGVDEADWAAEYRSPVDRYRKVVVADLPLPDLLALLDAADVRHRDETSLGEQLDALDLQSVRWSFSYFRILAATAAAAAIAGLVLYLVQLRRQRELGDALLRRMGLSAPARLRAALVEIGGLASLAFVAGTLVAIVVTRRIFARFEPDPLALPRTELTVSWPTLVALLLVAEAVVVGAVAAVHLRSTNRSLGEILREQ